MIACFLSLLLVISSPAARGQIEGPTEVPAGMLAMLRIDADAAVQNWTCKLIAPEDPSRMFLVLRTYDIGPVVLFQTITPGQYPIVLAKDNGDEAPILAQHVLTVRGATPIPGPINPGPGPVDPGPGPIDPVDPGPSLSGVALESYEAAMQCDRRPGEAAAMASDMREVVEIAGQNPAWNLPVLMSMWRKIRDARTKPAGYSTRWDPYSMFFGDKLMDIQRDNGGGQTVAARNALVQVLGEMAAGLDAVDGRTSAAVGSAGSAGEGTLKGAVQQIRGELHSLQREIGQ